MYINWHWRQRQAVMDYQQIQEDYPQHPYPQKNTSYSKKYEMEKLLPVEKKRLTHHIEHFRPCMTE